MPNRAVPTVRKIAKVVWLWVYTPSPCPPSSAQRRRPARWTTPYRWRQTCCWYSSTVTMCAMLCCVYQLQIKQGEWQLPQLEAREAASLCIWDMQPAGSNVVPWEATPPPKTLRQHAGLALQPPLAGPGVPVGQCWPGTAWLTTTCHTMCQGRVAAKGCSRWKPCSSSPVHAQMTMAKHDGLMSFRLSLHICRTLPDPPSCPPSSSSPPPPG